MKKSLQNILFLVLIGLGIFLLTKIQLLIIYFFVALVLSITINPLSNFLTSIRLWKFKINNTIAAILCLILICILTSLIGYILSPLIIEEIQIISSIKVEEIQDFITLATHQINSKLTNFNIEFENSFIDIFSMLNMSSITGLFQSMIVISGNILMAIFSILFISFFLIKDKKIIKESTIKTMDLLVPHAQEKINSIIYFIRRYFIGLCMQTIILFVLFGISMTILKIPNPWILAVFAAIINIIPYFGPLIGFLFTTTMIGTIYLDQDMSHMIMTLTIKTFFLFGCMQSIDNFIIQPSIYSKAFNAHPLEIFCVAMSAGFIGGLMWMVIAMPVYTIIRIIFSELLINLKKS